jgi:hypothetical protein
MTTSKTTQDRNAMRHEAERMRKLDELQVQEYCDRYHPERGQITIEVKGNIVVVRSKNPPDKKGG